MPPEGLSTDSRAGAQRSVPADGFVVLFDGTPLAARQGQTVAAVLLASGIRSWRTTRLGGRPRGVFCGIGICFDCLVVVNGVPNVRACVAEVRSGDVIGSQEGTGHVR